MRVARRLYADEAARARALGARGDLVLWWREGGAYGGFLFVLVCGAAPRRLSVLMLWRIKINVPVVCAPYTANCESAVVGAVRWILPTSRSNRTDCNRALACRPSARHESTTPLINAHE